MSILSPYALTTVEEAKGIIGRPPTKDGLWIYCSDATATAATATVSDTTLTLVDTGGAYAGTSTFTFSSASYNTIGELVDGINATSGWAAGAVYHKDAASTDLIKTGALSCLGAANEITLKVEDNFTIESLINRASDLVERYCGRRLLSRDYTNERYVGNGTKRLLLDNYPALSVSAVREGRESAFQVKQTSGASSAYIEIADSRVRLTTDGTATELEFADYATITLLRAAIDAVTGWECTAVSSAVGAMKSTDLLPNYGARYCLNEYVDVEVPDDYVQEYYLEGGVDELRGNGVLYNPWGWARGIEYHVSYVGGYSYTPYALEQAVLELIKYKHEAMQTSGLYKSESLGDYSFTLADMKKGIPDDTRQALDLFRRRVL